MAEQVCMACGMDPIKGRPVQLRPRDARYALCGACAKPSPPNAQNHGGVDLSAVELVVLARHLAGQHISEHDMWLDWGDVPELAEGTYWRLCEAMESLGNHLVNTASTFGFDAGRLYLRATES